MEHPRLIVLGFLAIGFLIAGSPVGVAETPENLKQKNLVAWCIVPFDGKERGPEARAKMLTELGLRRVAYDWRQKHVAEFEQEILAYQKYKIEYFAFWGAHEQAFSLFEKYDLHPQIWQMLPKFDQLPEAERIDAAVKWCLPLVKRTKEMGCSLGLYNHGGWGGEPANLIAICRRLRDDHHAQHVGIVYNLHHGHHRIDQWKSDLSRLRPYLLCLNLNGMVRNGDRDGKKILPLGHGDLDGDVFRNLVESGYTGPIGIIGHTQHDVRMRLQDNLDGLRWLLEEWKAPGVAAKPSYRTLEPPTR